MPQYWDLSTAEKRANFNEFVMGEILRGRKPVVKFEKPQRSGQQNNALHLWCRQIADVLNDGGHSVMEIMKHDAEIPWNEHLVKELLWRGVQRAMTGKQSSADCDKGEISDIAEVISRHLAQSAGVELPPFPSRSGG